MIRREPHIEPHISLAGLNVAGGSCLNVGLNMIVVVVVVAFRGTGRSVT